MAEGELLRAWTPAFEQVGAGLPEQTVTLTNIGALRQATGLTWEPATEAQYRVREVAPGVESVEQVEGLKYVTRGEGGPILGSLKSSYQLFGNAELFGLAETIGVAALEAGRTVTFLRGGELHGGRRVFLLAGLGERRIAGDPSPHGHYMVLLSAHNGSGAVKVLGSDVRWRSASSVRAAELHAAATAAAFSFRHTSKLSKRLADSRTAITRAMLQLEAIEDRTAALLAARIDPADASEYLRRFALAQVVAKANPQRQADAERSKARTNAVERVYDELSAVWASDACEGIRDCAYGPLTAVTAYLDNARPAENADTRFERTMVVTERGKVLAYDLARKMWRRS